jgi:hypothetical protein
MSMTKKEQAVVAELRQALALHRTGPVEPDVPCPGHFTKPDMVMGWGFNTYNQSVSRVWMTSLYSHNTLSEEEGPQPTQREGSWSQVHHPLFSTRERALRALRYAIEQEAAKKLADIDARIEAGA